MKKKHKNKLHELLEVYNFYEESHADQMLMLLEAFGGALTTKQANEIAMHLNLDFKPRTILRSLRHRDKVWSDRPFAPYDLTLRWMKK